MRRYGIALTLTALAAFVAAGHGHVAAATGARLTAITATDGAAPAVLIEASEPVAYRTARPDPFTVLVDLRNVATSGYANGFTARPDSPVRSVAVESARDDEGHQVARVRVSLSEPISHRVRSQRNLIFVELSDEAGVARTPTSPAASPRLPPTAPEATASPMAVAPARALMQRRRPASTAPRPASSWSATAASRPRTSSEPAPSVSISTFRASPPRRRRSPWSTRARSSACAWRSTARSRW